jgi:iron complex transport system permease protein
VAPAAVALLVLSVGLGLAIGPIRLPLGGIAKVLLDRLPFVSIDSGLSDRQTSIIWQFRAPRVVLGLIVGSMLSLAGASYQGAFRNPLADPYLLGVAAGAGLGATVAIVLRRGGSSIVLLPVAAFIGAIGAVALTYAVGGAAQRSSAARLVLSGVAIASFLTAAQTYVQQQHSEVLREVYGWILGRLNTASWADVRTVLPYVVVASTVLLVSRRTLDVMAVGDEEAASLGVDVARSRLIIVGAASLGTAAVVSVSGLIGFVGIIVPHTVRLLVGGTYRRILPLSMVLGGAFLVLTDLLARTIQSPAEVPIGVITAFLGAPFFLLVLRRRETAS